MDGVSPQHVGGFLCNVVVSMSSSPERFYNGFYPCCGIRDRGASGWVTRLEDRIQADQARPHPARAKRKMGGSLWPPYEEAHKIVIEAETSNVLLLAVKSKSPASKNYKILPEIKEVYYQEKD